MNPERIFEIVVYIIFVPLTLLIIYASIIGIKKDIRHHKKLKQELENPVVPAHIKTVNAKVTAKSCEMLKFGRTTNSNHKIIWWAEFLTDNGKIIRYKVPQELYNTLNKDDTGILATSGKEFFDFKKD